MIWVIVALLAIFGGLALLVTIVANAAAFNQAQAVRDVAHVAQTSADSLNWAIFAIVILAILLIGALAFAGFMFWRDRRREKQFQELMQQAGVSPQGRWAPGPNARFQRAGQAPSLPTGGNDMSQMVMALLAMRMMDQQARPPAQSPTNPPDPWSP